MSAYPHEHVAQSPKLTEELILDVDKMFSLADNLLVSVLDAVFNQNATAPISATANDLGLAGPLLAPGLGAQRLVGMLHVVSDWILRALNTNEVLVLSGATLEQKPINALISLVFITIDKVPTEDKVFSNVINRVTNQTHCNIVPRHSTILGLA